jgi:hypothetical protein
MALQVPKGWGFFDRRADSKPRCRVWVFRWVGPDQGIAVQRSRKLTLRQAFDHVVAHLA